MKETMLRRIALAVILAGGILLARPRALLAEQGGGGAACSDLICADNCPGNITAFCAAYKSGCLGSVCIGPGGAGEPCSSMRVYCYTDPFQ